MFHTTSPAHAVSRQLVRLWRYLVDATNRYSEVRVWQKRDRAGHPGWHGYDPISGDYVCFGTEDEIRSWIEQRYYTKREF